MRYVSLVLSLPTRNASARQRAWRALRASGAAVLRDGVYLMPARDDCRAILAAVARDVRECGGSAHLLDVVPDPGERFEGLFDRSDEFAGLLAETQQVQAALASGRVDASARQMRRLRKGFEALAAIDFFPGEAQGQTRRAVLELEAACERLRSPGEPNAAQGSVQHRDIAHFRGRVWATRRRPWIDRLACAWLIRRFIDGDARILWLASPDDCPADALGFDFDGATFSHYDGKVSFEVLAASFALDTPAMLRLGHLVHFLDVGGVQPPEANGVETILAGLRAGMADDDHLLAASLPVFDGLWGKFERDAPDAREQGA